MIDNPRQLERFTEWLRAGGATIEKPRSEWEYLRYTFAGFVNIVYRNKKGKLTYTNNSASHCKQWINNEKGPH